MQLNPIYLYSNRIDVFTNFGVWFTERYPKVYQRKLKIYRSVDNRIDLQLRNSDQKPTAIPTNSTVVFNLIGQDQKLILQKDCVESTTTLGKVYVTLTESDLNGLVPGFYQYSIYSELRETIDTDTYKVVSKTPLYSDSQYGAVGTIEVVGDLLGNVQPTVQIDTFTKQMNVQTNVIDYVSEIVYATPETDTPSSLHTFAMYTTNYTGRAFIEASLSIGGKPEIWTAVGTPVNFINTSGIATQNIVGKWNYFRVKYRSNNNGNAKFTVEQSAFGYYSVGIQDGGSSYLVGDNIFIAGSAIGGVNGINDLIITVTAVNPIGSVTEITHAGVSASGFRTFVLGGSDIPNNGTFDKVLYR